MSTPTEQMLGDAILNIVAGYGAEDVSRALSVSLALVISHEHFEAGSHLEDAEETLAHAQQISLDVLRRSWGKIELENRH